MLTDRPFVLPILRQIEAGLKKAGYLIEQRVLLKNGQMVRKDALLPGTKEVIIIKPDTPSGFAAAEKRATLMSGDGYQSDIILYDPKSPALLPGSPTYIGPK